MDLYGIIGYPVKHSLSPTMHNAAFKALDIKAKYEKIPIKPEDLEDFLLNNKKYKGFNITVPHKVRAMEILKNTGNLVHRQVADSKYIEFCGAINTVEREGEKIVCTNTDVIGFMSSLKQDLKFDHKDKGVLLIGCGGAGRAVIAGLSNGVRKIYAYDVNKDAIKSAEKLQCIFDKEIPGIVKECQLLVNATPIGMKKTDVSPIDKKILHNNMAVYDLVYNRETQLIKDAKSLGLPCSGGLGMLLYQGAHAFEFWTGKKAPVEVMKEALLKKLIL
ncbi:MAG: shikimate dehydrogenase [Candidatus Omnitrophica bacterium]|nr:shikimate dehydrogenase [Candidatus Omnitrophota bacterium]MBU4457683.1 shikimate dehydrogenase [Candidatus Omnitrophota bacterium]